MRRTLPSSHCTHPATDTAVSPVFHSTLVLAGSASSRRYPGRCWREVLATRSACRPRLAGASSSSHTVRPPLSAVDPSLVGPATGPGSQLQQRPARSPGSSSEACWNPLPPRDRTLHFPSFSGAGRDRRPSSARCPMPPGTEEREGKGYSGILIYCN